VPADGHASRWGATSGNAGPHRRRSASLAWIVSPRRMPIGWEQCQAERQSHGIRRALSSSCGRQKPECPPGHLTSQEIPSLVLTAVLSIELPDAPGVVRVFVEGLRCFSLAESLGTCAEGPAGCIDEAPRGGPAQPAGILPTHRHADVPREGNGAAKLLPAKCKPQCDCERKPLERMGPAQALPCPTRERRALS